MKKLAFVTRSLALGGTEKALVELLNRIPEDGYEVTLYLKEENLTLLDEIKRKVQIKYLPQRENSFKKVFFGYLKRFRFFKALKYLILKLSRSPVKKIDWANAYSLDKSEEYDFSACFYLPFCPEIKYNEYFINAKKKAIWIHLDVATYKDQVKKYYSSYKTADAVYCVCNDSKEKVISLFPKLKNKVKVLHNFLSRDRIERLSSEYEVEKFDGKTIFTCSRISEEKQPFIAVEALKILREKKYEVRWIWVGGGNEGLVNALKEKIEEYGLQDGFLLVGAKSNPYPYFKACDIYAQTSRDECYPVAITEALILCDKILSTNYPSAYEILNGFENAEITKKDALSVADGLEKLLLKESAPASLEQNLYPEELEEFLNYV